MREPPQPMGRQSLKPAACFQSLLTGLRSCQTCRQHTGVIYIPTRDVGYYCPKCCPACRDKPAAKGE
jgi:hypothetical protein